MCRTTISDPGPGTVTGAHRLALRLRRVGRRTTRNGAYPGRSNDHTGNWRRLQGSGRASRVCHTTRYVTGGVFRKLFGRLGLGGLEVAADTVPRRNRSSRAKQGFLARSTSPRTGSGKVPARASNSAGIATVVLFAAPSASSRGTPSDTEAAHRRRERLQDQTQPCITGCHQRESEW